MCIIAMDANENGQHNAETQSHRNSVWLDRYIEVPEHLKGDVMACCGYCNLFIENGKLTGILPHAMHN